MSDPDDDAARRNEDGNVAGSVGCGGEAERGEFVALEIEPQLVEKPWGGHLLDPGGRQRVGESWLYVPGGERASLVRTGAGGGRRVDHVLARPPQVLVKLLDCQRELSLQVHRNKWEGWLALRSQPDSSICSGLATGVTIAEFRDRLARGDSAALRPLLRTLHLAPGDFLANPPGTLHAIGAGHLILEVQTPEDETLRLSDWDRGGAEPRQLHVTEGLAAIDPTLQPTPQPASTAARRISTPLFALEIPDRGARPLEILGRDWRMTVDCETPHAPELRLWCEPGLFASETP